MFQPSNENYTDGSDQKVEDRTSTGFLKEISKLSQLNLSRLSHNKCNYTVLTTGNNDSTESLLRQHSTIQDTDDSSTPTRMIKSKSAYAFKKKYNGDDQGIEESDVDKPIKNLEPRITREPISVPNFTALTLPTPVLTPVEAARLVFLDSDEERDYQITSKQNQVNTEITTVLSNEHYENYITVKRGESYNSHLGYADNPLYQEITTTTTNVKFNNYPKVEEISDENNSTSDYASIETVSHVSSRNHSSLSRQKDEKCNVNLFRAKEKEGPFGFCNPNYMGPEINMLLNDNGWYDEDGKKQYAKILNTPDSVLEDNMGRSTSRHMFLEENVEMQNITNTEVSKAKHIKNCPKSLELDNNVLPNFKNKICNKSRASSASRADTKTIKRVNVREIEKKNVNPSSDVFVPLYVFVIGGKEHGQITVFKRPVSIWKLKLF